MNFALTYRVCCNTQHFLFVLKEMRSFKLVFCRFNIPDCKTISLPVEKTNSEAMELFHKNNEDGEYSLGKTIC